MAIRPGEREEKRDFTPCPMGTYPARCIDVQDLGMVKSEYAGVAKEKPMVKLLFEVNKVNPETNKPYLVSRRYTITTWPDAPLRAHVSGMLGRVFTDAEFQDFDLETLKGRMCLIVVSHANRNGRIYDNIDAITQLSTAPVAPPVPNFAFLSTQIQACFTHPGLEGLGVRAKDARKAGHITSEELQRLSELSLAQRQKIDELAAKSAPGSAKAEAEEDDNIPF
jgi:hypothetical protein